MWLGVFEQSAEEVDRGVYVCVCARFVRINVCLRKTFMSPPGVEPFKPLFSQAKASVGLTGRRIFFCTLCVLVCVCVCMLVSSRA